MKAKVILATILILAASCVKNEVREVSMHGDGQILYNPAPLRSMTTKADVSTMPSFPTSSTFGSCAWYLPGDNKWDDHHAAAATETVVPTPYIEPSVIRYNDGQWKAWDSKKSYYWPMNGSLTFISWAPYDLGLGKDAGTTFRVTRENGFEITGWTMVETPGYGIKTQATADKSSETDPKVDILLAQNKDCKKTADGKVVPRFSHLLCKVKVVATLAKPLGDNEKPWEITSVTLSNIYTKANYSTYVKDDMSKNKLWRDQDGLKDYVYPKTSGTSSSPTMKVTYKDKTVIFPETLFMPQFLDERVKDNSSIFPMITINCKNGVGEEKTLKGLLFNRNASSLSVWNQGRSITYYVTLGEEDTYIDFDAKVEDNDWAYILSDDSGKDLNVGVGEIINGK